MKRYKELLELQKNFHITKQTKASYSKEEAVGEDFDRHVEIPEGEKKE